MRTYQLASAKRKNQLHWTPREMTWDQFVTVMLQPPRDRKDCGGYVGGLLQATPDVPHPDCDDQPCRGLHKNAGAVVSRSLVALDADRASTTFVLDLTDDLDGTALVVYPTWSYSATEPRFRVVVPLNRDVTPEEYQLVVRALMADLGADQFDVGSAEPSRMMHLPSTQGVSPEPLAVTGDPLNAEVWLLRAAELGIELDAVRERGAPSYEGPAYADLSGAEQQLAEDYLATLLDSWRSRFAVALTWGDDQRDAKGRGWEALARDWAWACACLPNVPWLGVGDERAHELFEEVLPDELAVTPECMGKWSDSLIDKSSGEPVADPPWVTDFDVWVDPDEDDLIGSYSPATGGDPRAAVALVRPQVDVTDDAKALRWLRNEVGRRNLSGMFARGGEIVHTPRVGEAGYVPPKVEGADDGPAQVRRVGDLELCSRVDFAYRVERRGEGANGQSFTQAALFPREPARRVLTVVDLLPNARELRSVTHTPVTRRDGSILDTPGYDAQSEMLYLPDPGLKVEPVSAVPTATEVRAAVQLLLHMLTDFPFVTPHDKANYLGMMLTPLLRPVVPPPYKLGAIGAPQPGSGKSLLALVLRVLHGGVFKSEFPDSDAEFAKVVTATLDGTSAPVVQFDNVNGALKSSTLDGLLTSAEWSDRLLGASRMLNLTNDRLWVVTGNNIHIGGDLLRRVLWVTINVGAPHPELRTGFAIPDLEPWVRAHRGELLHALLTLIRHWDVQGRPCGPAPTSDSFGPWLQVLRGVIDCAGFGASVGTVGHEASVRENVDPEEAEWAAFLGAVHRQYGVAPWTARDLIDTVQLSGFKDGEGVAEEHLPGDLAARAMRDPVGAAKALGKLLSSRVDRWVDQLSVQSMDQNGKKARYWCIAVSGEL